MAGGSLYYSPVGPLSISPSGHQSRVILGVPQVIAKKFISSSVGDVGTRWIEAERECKNRGSLASVLGEYFFRLLDLC